jgi:hypothetical protein
MIHEDIITFFLSSVAKNPERKKRKKNMFNVNYLKSHFL